MRDTKSESFLVKYLNITGKLRARNILHYAIIFLSSLFYSLHVKFSLGADYGIYFVGAKFSGAAFPLYEGFFDHKGPFTYLILKVIINLFGFSTLVASAFAFLNSFIFMFLARKLLTTSFGAVNSWLILFIALFVAAQNANTTINFIAANLLLIAYLAIEKIQHNQGILVLIVIAFCITALGFTAPWSIFLGLLLFFTTIEQMSLGKGFTFICIVITSAFVLFASFQNYLGMSFGDYMYSNFFFNAFEYPGIVREESGLGPISSIMLQSRLFNISGIPILLIVYLLLSGRIRRKLFILISCIFLCCIALLAGSDHVHYSIWLAVALILVVRNTESSVISSSFAVVVASTLAFALLLTPSLYSKSSYVGCALKLKTLGCGSPYISLENAIANAGRNYSHEFLGNDPWPYLLTRQTPHINFASNYNFAWDREVPRRMHIYWVKKTANLQNGLGEFVKNLKGNKSYSEELNAGDWIGFKLD